LETPNRPLFFIFRSLVLKSDKEEDYNKSKYHCLKEEIKMGNKLKEILGISGVSETYLKVVELNVCYLIFTNLHTLFVNTLFINLTGDTNAVMKYNIVDSILLAVFMYFAVHFIHRFSCKHSFVVGLVGFVVLYITFFALMEDLDKYVYLIAVIAAFAQTFFSTAQLNATSVLSKDTNISQTVAFNSLANGVVSLLMPYISGAIISANEGLKGYYVVFGLSALVAIYAFYKALRLPEISIDAEKPDYRAMLRIVKKDRTWQAFCISETLNGCRGGVFRFYLSVLIYQIIQSEYLVGVNNVAVGIFAILASWFNARTVRNSNRFHLVFYAIHALMISVCSLYFNMSVATLMIFASVNSFCGCVMGNGYTSMFYMAVKKTPGAKGLDGEFINLSQTMLGIGQTAGILLTSYLSQSGAEGSVTALVLLVGIQYICASLFKYMQDRLLPGEEKFPLLDKLFHKKEA